VLAQSLRVLSEFQRVDPFGEVVPVDRTPQPREILSPGVARNGFASFHIVASVPEREPFFIYVETNPADVFRISLYKELYVKSGDGWIPDVLEPMKQPIFDTLPYFPMPIAGQTTVSYWMDIWVPADAAINRVRLEVLMKIGSGWIMYPMEVRVMPAVGPVVWGARTTVGADQLPNQWKYLPVRRLALYIEESLRRGTLWAVFEPNDEPLWSSLRLNVTTFMQGLFRQGAFAGSTPKDAYLVQCDANNNPPDQVALGIVNILVGFAPLYPAEFVIISIQQQAPQA